MTNKEFLLELLDPDLLEKHHDSLNGPMLRQHLWVVTQIRWGRSLAKRKAKWHQIRAGVHNDIHTGKVPVQRIG